MIAMWLVGQPVLAKDLPAPPMGDAVPAPVPERGKLLATAGLIQLEGAGGGGLAPWAFITGYGTRDAVGANLHGTVVRVTDFILSTAGVAVGLYDRLELSYARQVFDSGVVGRGLGIGGGFQFSQDVYGAKLRLFGDGVMDQDSWLPQVAAGVQHKVNNRRAVLRAIGARSDQGTDFYLAATKLFLAQSLVLNATVRMTRANQLGILGFGGDRNNAYRPEFEGSVALLLSRTVAVGAEYRTKPNNLRFARESDWFDVFVTWLPTKSVSATLAYVNLGSIATRKQQEGVYASIQLGF
ncbi:MAG: DUF3034 family protein [Gemmatimonadaceae bacterium]|nr:DUF3034 family protein [Acetobacteraceae bacterium]